MSYEEHNKRVYLMRLQKEAQQLVKDSEELAVIKSTYRILIIHKDILKNSYKHTVCDNHLYDLEIVNITDRNEKVVAVFEISQGTIIKEKKFNQKSIYNWFYNIFKNNKRNG